jgi:hypothetical protein
MVVLPFAKMAGGPERERFLLAAIMAIDGVAY